MRLGQPWAPWTLVIDHRPRQVQLIRRDAQRQGPKRFEARRARTVCPRRCSTITGTEGAVAVNHHAARPEQQTGRRRREIAPDQGRGWASPSIRVMRNRRPPGDQPLPPGRRAARIAARSPSPAAPAATSRRRPARAVKRNRSSPKPPDCQNAAGNRTQRADQPDRRARPGSPARAAALAALIPRQQGAPRVRRRPGHPAGRPQLLHLVDQGRLAHDA